MIAAGPGWIIPGAAKMAGGAFLAFVALQAELPIAHALEPTQMYLRQVSHSGLGSGWPGLGARASTGLLVLVSQTNINITNAYAGSLAWSNVFARLTHSHPGRVVWLCIQRADRGDADGHGRVRGIGASAGALRPPGGGVGRRHLWRSRYQQAASTVAARYRIPPRLPVRHQSGRLRRHGAGLGAVDAGASRRVRRDAASGLGGGGTRAGDPAAAGDRLPHTEPLFHRAGTGPLRRAARGHPLRDLPQPVRAGGRGRMPGLSRPDLLVVLHARCALRRPRCKPGASAQEQIAFALTRVLPAGTPLVMARRIGQFEVSCWPAWCSRSARCCGCCYTQEQLSGSLVQSGAPRTDLFLKIGAGLVLFAAVASWWLVLANESRTVAQEESERQNGLLQKEIDAPSYRCGASACQGSRGAGQCRQEPGSSPA